MKAWSFFLVLLSGCATYTSYRCPDPIGEIVRQDCESYRVKYQELAAKLTFSVGTVQVGAEIGTEKLRDPSRLVEMMMQQMLALCQDYNSCRLESREYQRRREEADRLFTAVLALVEQLGNTSLGAEEKKQLIEKLAALFIPPSGAQGVAMQKQPQIKSEPRVFRTTNGLWFESKYQPPWPPAIEEQVPYLVRQEPGEGRLELTFFGPAEEDDFVVLDDGRRCPVRVSGVKRPALARAQCVGDGPIRNITYLPGATGRTVALPPWKLADLPLPRAWMAFQPEPIDAVKVERERPHLIIEEAEKKAPFVSARCLKDGRSVEVDGSPVLSAAGPGLGKIRFRVIHLPWTLSAGGLKSELSESPAGGWECTVSFEGKPRLKVLFEIDKRGIPRPHPAQAGRSGDIASPWWLLESRVLEGN
jgi:hypothetical protein